MHTTKTWLQKSLYQTRLISVTFDKPTTRNIYLSTHHMCDFWSFDRKTYTWSSPKSSHSWNPADFTMKSGNFMKSVKSGRFHPWNLADFTCEIWRISWNLVDFTLKSGRFHEIREIWQISPWNLVDFMKSVKSGRFHPDITCKIHPKL